MAQRLILLSFLISIMCLLSQQMPTPEPNNKSMNETYLECKSMTSRCFGMPSDCLAKQNCEVLLSSNQSSNWLPIKLIHNQKVPYFRLRLGKS